MPLEYLLKYERHIEEKMNCEYEGKMNRDTLLHLMLMDDSDHFIYSEKMKL